MHLFNSFYPMQPPKNSLDIFTPTWFTSSTFLSKDDHRKIVAGTNSHQVIFHCKFFFHFGMNNWILLTSGNATFLRIFSSLLLSFVHVLLDTDWNWFFSVYLNSLQLRYHWMLCHKREYPCSTCYWSWAIKLTMTNNTPRMKFLNFSSFIWS